MAPALQPAIQSLLADNLAIPNVIEKYGCKYIIKNHLIIHTNQPFTEKKLVGGLPQKGSIQELRTILNSLRFRRGKRIKRYKFFMPELVPKRIGFPLGNIEDKDIIPCCWDQTLFLVINESFYNEFDTESRPPSTDGEDELNVEEVLPDAAYNNEPEEPPIDIQAHYNEVQYIKPDQNSTELLFKRGNGEAQSASDFRKIDCEEIKSESYKTLCNAIKDLKCKRHIKVGVIDIGYPGKNEEKTHASTVRDIIIGFKGNKKKVIDLDYNSLEYFNKANSFTVSCQIARGISENVDILNISLGYLDCRANASLIKYFNKAEHAGILIVTSAGNYNNNNDRNPHWPSNFAEKKNNVIAVASSGSFRRFCGPDTERDSDRASYSNYGRRTVSLTENGAYGADHDPIQDPTQSVYKGTSFAAARISAKVAHLFYAYGKTAFITDNGFDKALLMAHVSALIDG